MSKCAKSCLELPAINDALSWAGQGWKDLCLNSSLEKLGIRNYFGLKLRIRMDMLISNTAYLKYQGLNLLYNQIWSTRKFLTSVPRTNL